MDKADKTAASFVVLIILALALFIANKTGKNAVCDYNCGEQEGYWKIEPQRNPASHCECIHIEVMEPS